MNKPLVLAVLSGLVLVGAAYPDGDQMGSGDRRHAARADDAPRTYRPCRSRRDDNCIQLYERGVRAAYARWLRDGDPGYDEAVRYAVHDGRSYGGHRRHDHARGERRREHRDHRSDAGHAAHAGHGSAHRQPGRPRLAMIDVSRCDRHGERRVIVRTPRPPEARPAPRPHARPRGHEDSGVRGM